MVNLTMYERPRRPSDALQSLAATFLDSIFVQLVLDSTVKDVCCHDYRYAVAGVGLSVHVAQGVACQLASVAKTMA